MTKIESKRTKRYVESRFVVYDDDDSITLPPRNILELAPLEIWIHIMFFGFSYSLHDASFRRLWSFRLISKRFAYLIMKFLEHITSYRCSKVTLLRTGLLYLPNLRVLDLKACTGLKSEDVYLIREKVRRLSQLFLPSTANLACNVKSKFLRAIPHTIPVLDFDFNREGCLPFVALKKNIDATLLQKLTSSVTTLVLTGTLDRLRISQFREFSSLKILIIKGYIKMEYCSKFWSISCKNLVEFHCITATLPGEIALNSPCLEILDLAYSKGLDLICTNIRNCGCLEHILFYHQDCLRILGLPSMEVKVRKQLFKNLLKRGAKFRNVHTLTLRRMVVLSMDHTEEDDYILDLFPRVELIN